VEYAAQPPVAVARPESGLLQRVFMWMFVGLAITGGVAAAIGSSDSLLTDITETRGIVIGVVIAQLGLVFFLAFMINRISVPVATGLSSFTRYWITTYAGVVIFAALTAYDLQKLTQISRSGISGEAEGRGGDHGRPRPLPRLHQPVHLPAADLRPLALAAIVNR
jgi:FtsH-binding integral membrane protein